MRILHAVKTLDGAKWAIDQVEELVKRGFDIHVALPEGAGRFSGHWKKTGATLHSLSTDIPVRTPWHLGRTLDSIRKLVAFIEPDIIHSHFFGTTVAFRLALGKHHPVPRLFQVPGPLHMEHRAFRNLELWSAGPNDHWIASSQYIRTLYDAAGIPSDRTFLSYYGTKLPEHRNRSGELRTRLGLGASNLLVGNINHIYKPKWYLGQARGLKGHEDLIAALVRLLDNNDIVGVFIGGQWGGGTRYENRLRLYAKRVGGGRIIMPGHLPPEQVADAWADFDVAVHVPLSENCGGVIEPLLAGVPVIAARVGGLPEVIMNGVTGTLVEPGNIVDLASTIKKVLSDLELYRAIAKRGERLVRTMFDVRRTATEIAEIYAHIKTAGVPRPCLFDARKFLGETRPEEFSAGSST